jgi:hypothetical protein
VLVELAIEVDRLRHVARIDILAALDLPGDLSRGVEGDQNLGVDAFVVDRIRCVQRPR